MSDHLISYDLARGLHIIAVIAWMCGMLMLPRLYASITVLPPDNALVRELLTQARRVRIIILTPAMVLAWAFGIFLFFAYFAPDWDELGDRFAAVPHWFWLKLALVLALTAYHGLLVAAGRRLAGGERPRSQGFWRALSILPFFAAAAIVLLATLEP